MDLTARSSSVRVRFAPSPTGYLHVGGGRSLLFNLLYAKKTGGALVLRIEDTDQARSTKQAEAMIFEDIQKLGITPDESPLKPGTFSPYRQSERLSIYGDHAKALLEKNQAYYCFCPEAVLTEKRELALKLGKPPVYDGTCAKIPLAEAKTRLKNGEKAGIRFRAFNKDYVLKDLVKGDVSFSAGVVGDFFITRTPREDENEIAEGIGMPVYNFCCVIDDHLMGMTHVIRGDDHLSNTARQLMIYDAYGWTLPEFAHIAMVLGADRQKLSKRNGDSSVHDYLDKGYLPHALLNFLALLGWSPGSELKTENGHPEIFSLAELVGLFSIAGLQKAPAVFDVQKLNWMNSMYLRASPLEEILERVKPFFAQSEHAAIFGQQDAAWIRSAVELVRGECVLLSDIPVQVAHYLDIEHAPEAEALALFQEPKAKEVFSAIENMLGDFPEILTAEHVEKMQKEIQSKVQVKGKALFMPLRAATTLKVHGPELKKVLPLLGKTLVMKRMQSLKTRIL